MEPFRCGGEEGGDVVWWPLELDTDATSADTRAVALRLGDGGGRTEGTLEPLLTGMLGLLLVVELRRHRRRLRPLIVEAMLTESESHMLSGERK